MTHFLRSEAKANARASRLPSCAAASAPICSRSENGSRRCRFHPDAANFRLFGCVRGEEGLVQVLHLRGASRVGATQQVTTQAASKVESLLMSGQKNHLSLNCTVTEYHLWKERPAVKTAAPRFTAGPARRLYRLESPVWRPLHANAVGGCQPPTVRR